jgi:hypothetical protein
MSGFITRKNVTFWQVFKAFGLIVAVRFLLGRKRTFLDCIYGKERKP